MSRPDPNVAIPLPWHPPPAQRPLFGGMTDFSPQIPTIFMWVPLPLTERQWYYLMGVMYTMKPGLVSELPEPPVPDDAPAD